MHFCTLQVVAVTAAPALSFQPKFFVFLLLLALLQCKVEEAKYSGASCFATLSGVVAAGVTSWCFLVPLHDIK